MATHHAYGHSRKPQTAGTPRPRVAIKAASAASFLRPAAGPAWESPALCRHHAPDGRKDPPLPARDTVKAIPAARLAAPVRGSDAGPSHTTAPAPDSTAAPTARAAVVGTAADPIGMAAADRGEKDGRPDAVPGRDEEAGVSAPDRGGAVGALVRGRGGVAGTGRTREHTPAHQAGTCPPSTARMCCLYFWAAWCKKRLRPRPTAFPSLCLSDPSSPT